jgi:hypothetical protein
MKTWRVKTKGRIERFLIVFIIPIVLELWDVDLSFLGNIGWFGWTMIIVFTSFLWIPILMVVTNKLVNQKIPLQITFDEESKLCEINYSKNKTDTIPFENLKYSYSDDNKMHNSITFFRSFIGTRGQIVTNKVSEIVGFKYTFSWNKKQVNELHSYLKRIEISSTNTENENLPLWEKMLSD